MICRKTTRSLARLILSMSLVLSVFATGFSSYAMIKQDDLVEKTLTITPSTSSETAVQGTALSDTELTMAANGPFEVVQLVVALQKDGAPVTINSVFSELKLKIGESETSVEADNDTAIVPDVMGVNSEMPVELTLSKVLKSTAPAGTYTIIVKAAEPVYNDEEDGEYKVYATGTYTITVTSMGNEKDTTPPVITLNGSNPASITVGYTYTDAGATAKDDVDGDVPVQVSGTVNTAVVGAYTITYTAKDKSNNTATKTRTVNVVSGGYSGGGDPIPGSKLVEDPKLKALEEESMFDDLDSVPWAKDKIEDLAKKGILKGKEDGKFKPKDIITRAEFCEMIVNTYGLKDDTATVAFSDVKPGDWFYKSVAIALKSGIIEGYSSTKFAPQKTISRQEMAAMVSRALINVKHVAVPENINEYLKFTDSSKIYDYAKQGVAMVVKYSIMQGYENNTFKPLNKTNRAESAVVAYNLYYMK
jgi:hypothetical protein